MSDDLFGGPVGTIRYNEDALTRAQTQESLGRAAGQPAVNRLRAAQAEGAELELQEERRMAALLAGQASGSVAAGAVDKDGKPRPLSEIYGNLARMAMGAGAPNKAAEFAKFSGTLRSQEATAARGDALAELNGLKAQQQRVEFGARLLDDVKDDQSWNRAQLLYQVATGEKSMYAGLPYSEDLVKRMRAMGQTVTQQIDTRRKALESASRERARSGLATYRTEMAAVAKKRLELSTNREERLAKAGGGKGVTSPAKAEVDQASRLLKTDFKDLSPEDTLNASYELAAEARAIRQKNPAVDANTALQQAFVAAKSRGDFKDIVEKGFFKNNSRKVFSGAGRTPETAGAVPADASARVYNRYYTNDKGAVAKWTKEGWEPYEDPDEEEEESE